ncbi:hypothetical protein [Paenibacillus sp. J22TS3]|uniref:hypothetical protein n=1 Tax=Paenibacillus sp. J22TS3 TaxID=2807192 RepID=UPI001B26D3D3|nr:hypothetical protein [Paenibacillus sp. J22TS3]GIP24487.1 hypothetical protein J22TS3_47620 [Paenibacillus sp. J22TS3]
MIPNTEKLIQLLKSGQKTDASVLASYCRITSKYGDREDAAALFQMFTEHASDYKYTLLLDPVMRCGDLALAEEIDRFCFEQGQLKEGMPDEVLHVMGYMGYEKYIDYMVDCIVADEWHLCTSACLGLLHLPCESHGERLANALDKVYGQPLFPELLPALSFKFANEQIVPRLLAWGEQASTDCNAGLVLGISMFGSTQKNQVKSILMEPFWEMYSSGTGSYWWGYMSMQMAQLTFKELISDIKARMPVEQKHADQVPDKRTMEHWLHVLHDLLELKLSDIPHPVRFSPLNQESVIDLFQELFQWSNEHKDDALTGRISTFFGYNHPLMDKYMQLRARMEMGIKQELELQVWASGGKYLI